MSQRSLRIENCPGTALLQIAWNGGGELPAALHGLYTSSTEAQRAIDMWASTARPVAVEDRTMETKEEEQTRRGPGRPPKAPIQPI